MQLEFTRTGPYEYSCTVHGPTDPYVAQYNTVQLYSRRKLAGIQRSLRNPRISRNRRNLQNRNSAAAEIAIRFGPKILLKCDRRETGPKYPCTGLDYGYKSSFSLNHRFNHYDRRTGASILLLRSVDLPDLGLLDFQPSPPGALARNG
jgi:hypothetical protein